MCLDDDVVTNKFWAEILEMKGMIKIWLRSSGHFSAVFFFCIFYKAYPNGCILHNKILFSSRPITENFSIFVKLFKSIHLRND